MTPATLNDRPFTSPTRNSAVAALRAAVEALRTRLRRQRAERALTLAPIGEHRLGAWDLARSDLARECLAMPRCGPTIHMKRRPAPG